MMAWTPQYQNQNQQSNNGGGDPTDQSDKYDANVIDEGDLLDERDLKVNPQIYIHQALQRSQVALLNPNLEAGLTQFVFLIQQIETLCGSARLIDEVEYKRILDEFKSTDDYKSEKRALYQHMQLSQKKLEFLLKALFDNRTSNAPLKL
jgi:hypothetical protein